MMCAVHTVNQISLWGDHIIIYFVFFYYIIINIRCMLDIWKIYLESWVDYNSKQNQLRVVVFKIIKLQKVFRCNFWIWSKIWSTSGLLLVHFWSTPGPLLSHFWSTSGPFLVNFQYIYGTLPVNFVYIECPQLCTFNILGL